MEEREVGILAGSVPEIGRWMWCLEDTRRRTLAAVEGISEAALEWRLDEQANTISMLLYHIAAIEVDYLYADIYEGREFPPEILRMFPYDVRNEEGALWLVSDGYEQHMTRLAATRLRLLDAYREMTLADFRRVRTFTDYAISPEWIVHHLMQHEAEHRGQIEILREQAERQLGLS
jgi:uncharacterized damage-inducible protein DinB